MAGNVYLDEGDVQVTDSHLAMSGRTVPLQHIEAVQQSKEEQLGCLPNILIGLGVLIVLASVLQGIAAAVFGFALIAGGVLWYRRLRPTYYILLSTTDGKMRALDTKNKERIDRVHAALTKALAKN